MYNNVSRHQISPVVASDFSPGQILQPPVPKKVSTETPGQFQCLQWSSQFLCWDVLPGHFPQPLESDHCCCKTTTRKEEPAAWALKTWSGTLRGISQGEPAHASSPGAWGGAVLPPNNLLPSDTLKVCQRWAAHILLRRKRSLQRCFSGWDRRKDSGTKGKEQVKLFLQPDFPLGLFQHKLIPLWRSK